MNSTLASYIKRGTSPVEERFITIEQLQTKLSELDAPLIVYGAGASCSDVLKILFEKGIKVSCITDSDPAKANTSIMNIPVHAPEDAIKQTGPNSICLVAIWSIATFYRSFLDRLDALGYQQVYFLNHAIRSRILSHELVAEVQNHKDNLLRIYDKMSGAVSKQRFEDYIYSFLSSTLNYKGVLGHYHSLDGKLLSNDLIQLNSQDVLIHCRCGYNNDSDSYLQMLFNIKEAYLFEPSVSGRVKTKEFLYDYPQHSRHIRVFPYILGNQEIETSFDEKIYFNRFIDQEEYKASRSQMLRLDQLIVDIQPSIIHLDMAGGHVEALQGALEMINLNKPTLLLSGFRKINEIIELITAYPQFKYNMRYFGGITMRDGYYLIVNTKDTRDAHI